ncbi:hypothetical protein [Paraburkholderia sp. MM6662-R1]|uniref:hypothetical protein n=1 Tax=Paraburkholderia sp. MM6662-R1 TaxID=2991066 RepID=UPI003D22828E
MNSLEKKIRRLPDTVIDWRVRRPVILDKDRLLRFGAELTSVTCAAKNVEVVTLNQGEETTFEEDLRRDVPEITRLYNGPLQSSRARKNWNLLCGVRHALENAQSC